MLEISPKKVAHVIVRAREIDAKVEVWDDPDAGFEMEDDADAILEERGNDATTNEAKQFIAGLNVDEKAHLVALAWVGRGTFSAEEFVETVQTAYEERARPTQDYLLALPLLADYLEEGLEKLGYTIEDVEHGIL